MNSDAHSAPSQETHHRGSDDVVDRLQHSGIFRDYQQAFQTATGLPLVLRAAGSFRTPMQGARNISPFCALMAARSKNERIEHTVKGVNSVLWFCLFTPLVVKDFFLKKFMKAGIQTGAEGMASRFKRSIGGNIPSYRELMKLQGPLRQQALKIKNQYTLASWVIPVTMLVLLQQMLVAHPSLPASNLAELIALAKQKPGTINYASYGSGSQPHLAGEMLKHKAGIDLVHVPYKGISLAVPAVMAGEVQLTFSGIATGMGPVKAGRIKAIAIGGKSRSPLLPQVPTFTELGYPEVETHAWFGFFVPAGSPTEAVTRISQDTKKILEDPGFRQKALIDRGYEPVGSSPEEFASYIKSDSESRARAVKISGAKAE